MLEVGETPTLCRNGKSPIQQLIRLKRTPEQEQTGFCPLSARTRGIFMSNLALAEQLAETKPAVAESGPSLRIVQGGAEALYVNADDIDQLSIARQQARQEAEQLLQERRRDMFAGRLEAIPESVDALGTARKLAGVGREFREDSPEYQDHLSGLYLDCQRLLAEAWRKRRPEYFASLHQVRDEATGGYYSHGVLIGTMIDQGGLSPLAKPEEQQRRVNESVEERTYEAIGRSLGRISLSQLIEQEAIEVQTISQCPDEIIAEYKRGEGNGYMGYVPEIEKLYIRGVKFDARSSDRFQEGLAVPGIYITHEVILQVLKQTGALKSSHNPDKTELHGQQFITTAQGVLGLAQRLDQAASEKFGKNIFLGEEVPADYPKDYSRVPVESKVRQDALISNSRELAGYVMELESKGVDPSIAPALVSKRVKEMMLIAAKQNPDKAAEMFDEETAEGFRQVAALELSGRYSEAAELQKAVEEAAPDPEFCGAGSCGLEAVDENSLGAQAAHEAGLEGELLHDTERACPECDQKKVYYDKKGNKACINKDCGYKEINGKISGGKNKQ